MVETRFWRDKDKKFGPYTQADNSLFHVERIKLPAWVRPSPPASASSPSLSVKHGVSSSTEGKVMTTIPVTDAFAAARRKLIVHFFRLGTIARYQAVQDAGVWDETDEAFDGQSRWARVFERAEKAEKLALLWDAVAARDDTLAGQTNPFTS